MMRVSAGIVRYPDERILICRRGEGRKNAHLWEFPGGKQEAGESPEDALRRELLEKQRKTVEAEIAHMNKVLDMLRFKCWYYDQAIQDGSEDRIKSLLPDHLPDDIQPLYDHAHQ